MNRSPRKPRPKNQSSSASVGAVPVNDWRDLGESVEQESREVAKGTRLARRTYDCDKTGKKKNTKSQGR